MKRVYSRITIISCLCTMIICLLITIYCFINYYTNPFITLIGYCFLAVAIVAGPVKIFALPDYIELSEDKVRVLNVPFFATNKFYVGKHDLILWNNEINLKEVEKIEIVNLTKNEKMNYIGYNHLLSKYLKIYFKNSNANKYIYISIYTNKQLMEILKYFEK